MIPQFFQGKSGRGAAFSLVEVTLAMGIISFGLLAVMAMMPVGLNTMRAAMDQTLETQIVRQLGGEILLMPFSRISDKFHGKSFYYDDEGNLEYDEQGQLAVRETARSRYAVFTAVAEAAYPGSADFSLANPVTNSLATVRVEVVTPAGSPAVNRATNVYHLRIPNSGE